MERLKDICEIIFKKREKVLVFTQFKEMVKPQIAFFKNYPRAKALFCTEEPVKKGLELLSSLDKFNKPRANLYVSENLFPPPNSLTCV